MRNKYNQQTFEDAICESTNGEYIVVGEYVNVKTKVLIRHNHCSHPDGYYDFKTTADAFLGKRQRRCPYCANQAGYGVERFIERLNNKQPQYKCLDSTYINSNTPLKVMCDNGHTFDLTMDQLKSNKHSCRCPYCSNKKVLVGFNNLNYTHKWLGDLLVNYEDGNNYMFGSTEELDFKCPRCGNIVHKRPYLAINKHNELICQNCSDGFSYPEKYFGCLLRQLNIDYTYQLSSKHYTWCNSYRYDFYDEYNRYVFELHGMHHYKDGCFLQSLKDIQKNDADKMKNADGNVSKYIVIDCRYSDSDYIKQQIIKTIGDLYDLSKIDWESCEKLANKSIMLDICEKWDNAISTLQEFSAKYNLDSTTIKKYLERGSILGLCDYNHDEYNLRINVNQGKNKRKPVLCIETNIQYDSTKDVERKTGISSSQISGVCRGIHKTAHGMHWRFV